MIGANIRPDAPEPGVPTLDPDLELLFAEVDAIMVAAEAPTRAPLRPRRQAPARLIPPRTDTAPRKPVRWLCGRPTPGPRATQRGPPPQ
ncbi:hypothetical protein [Nocardia brevicatena]|uniref:hypothetical protein n=1 Tax=Nocardia brevicatena TaxID=37327 RepID=UPI0002FBA522|nr:hypothetical protein [Nocardia brevicatena]